jgi:hypothetical protein
MRVSVHRLIGSALAAATLLLAAQAPASGAESAVWVKKKMHFIFQGFTAVYSCEGLEDDMRTVLLQLGARQSDMKLQQINCGSGFNLPEPNPGLTGTFYVLEPASSAAGDNAQPGAGAVQAQWQTVNVRLTRDARLQAGQCELIDQVKAKILPLFPARDVKFQSTCYPNELLVKGSTLEAKVLKPVKAEREADAAQ